MQNISIPIIKIVFRLEALNTIALPVYKGSTFHGGLGHALKDGLPNPSAFQYFYQPRQHNDWPKPFVLLPPLDDLQTYETGHRFSFEVTLFGEAVKYHPLIKSVVEYWGNNMGLGYNKGKFKIVNTELITPVSKTEKHNEITSTLKLSFPTRLRLKENNKLKRSPPSFETLMQRLSGRLKTLNKAYGENKDLLMPDDLLQQAKAIKIENTNMHWDDWDRFSGRQKTWMKFGGLIGEISYQGNLSPFLPYLELGEWVYIGGKTSFGLGKYALSDQGEKV
jgi:hypothetical protein